MRTIYHATSKSVANPYAKSASRKAGIVVEQQHAEPLYWFLVINARSPHAERIGWLIEAKDGRITLDFDDKRGQERVEFEGWEVVPFYVS